MRLRTHPRVETDLGDVSQSTRDDHVRPQEQALTLTANLMSGVAFPPIRRLHTVPEVAAVLNVSIRTVRRLIKDEKLPIVHVGRSVRIRPEALEALIDGG
jgi:excisionase family DNA binding protein